MAIRMQGTGFSAGGASALDARHGDPPELGDVGRIDVDVGQNRGTTVHSVMFPTSDHYGSVTVARVEMGYDRDGSHAEAIAVSC